MLGRLGASNRLNEMPRCRCFSEFVQVFVGLGRLCEDLIVHVGLDKGYHLCEMIRFTPALLMLLALASCEGSSNSDRWTCHCTLDADVVDATAGVDCNPVTQLGCEADEKCSQVVESEEPFLARTTCVPDGIVATSEACSLGQPGAATGFDDCVAGDICIAGTCERICSNGPSDSCRRADEAQGTGQYCATNANIFQFGFPGIGTCADACDISAGTIVDGAVVSPDCQAGAGCYVEASSGGASCRLTPGTATDPTQNEDCIGGVNGCDTNGCASGFAALLPLQRNVAPSLCTRLCTPANSHASAQADIAGTEGNCQNISLQQLGGTNGNSANHQCRFVQSFSGGSEGAPSSIGMCVPVSNNKGTEWGDCSLLDWDGMKAAWADAADGPEAQSTALNNFCLVEPENPSTSEILERCRGLWNGCLSLDEIALGLPSQ